MPRSRSSTPRKASKKKPLPINSIAEFARQLNLSGWTVSRAINGHPEVNEQTRQRIFRAMDELGFRPNPLAAGLGGRRTNMVGVCFWGLGNPIVDRKVFHLQEFLRSRHLRSFLELRSRDVAQEIRAIEDFQRIRVDGIVLLHSDLDVGVSARLLKHTACVHVDPHEMHQAPCVLVDRLKAMRLLIDHLRAFGHRRFGLLGIDERDVWRWPALLEIARVYQYNPDDAYIRIADPAATESPIERGQLLAEEILKQTNRPTALIAVNDSLAIGAIQALRQAGLEVPRDMSVTGFDNLDIGRRLHPTLTTIDQNPRLLMERAGETLIAQMGLPRTERGLRSLENVEPQLVIGESTGPAPRAG